jgi:hypothetical protein
MVRGDNGRVSHDPSCHRSLSRQDRGPGEGIVLDLGWWDLLEWLRSLRPTRRKNRARASIPSVAAARAEQWALSAPPLVGYFDVLRDPALSQADRTQAMDELRQEAEDELRVRGGW